MLLEMILIVIVGAIESLASLIPVIEFNPQFLQGFSSVTEVMGLMSYVVPMGVFMGCLSLFFLLQNITLVIALVNWVVRKIPTIG